ncbi:biogenesis of lysosome-related organelles complex 1 subunit 4-like [Dermacentor silvarum]|uniref:biogenesis of lysosome-related organelles complex 1 subunit 4-like n=1 Tax=Dermacentor silvarum TaxID=543639 RepID=UPI0018976A3B|nr:biogenesis of lysosome-related organelles complex 1 subunit 4-like [Dermacentor silvarum]
MEESAAGLDDGASSENGQTRQLLEELAADYSQFFRVDICNDKRILDEGIDELLARLDEFTGLINMVRSDDTLCLTHTLPDICEKSKGLEQVYDRIDALEKFVGVVRESVDAMEEKVTEAENAFGGSTVKKFLSSLPSPLFAKKPAPQYKKQLRYEEPDIFRCSDYLSTVSADDPLPTSVSNFSLDTSASDRSVEDDRTPLSPVD